MISNTNSDGQKRCSCKKSKCLKLYCDCFSAGLYCDGACSCQECLNRPDYEDTVDETRQQIELRNPLAFSPKIHCLTQSPTSQIMEDGDLPTPIAGKHKKGCNCKKSMCAKRYCECYHANVGCSSECRCEGCQNVFGKKGAFPEYDVYNELIPWTPFQHSGHKEDTSTSTSTTGLFPGCYIPSPGSADCEMILGTSNENFDMVPNLDQQSYPNVEFMNQFTPPDGTQFNDGHLTSMTDLIPPLTDWPNSSRANGNLHWPGSLVSPIPLFGGPKVNAFNEKPTDTIHDNTINASSCTYIHPNTSRVTSPGGK